MKKTKQSGAGLLTLIAGMAAGAAAVFLSKKENRDKTKKIISKATVKAKKLRDEYQNDPNKALADLKREGKKVADSVMKKVKQKTAKKIAAKKTVKRTKKA